MSETIYISEIDIEDETIEVHRCPFCKALFGIDVTYLIQVSETVTCMMCANEVEVAEAIVLVEA